MRPLHLFLPLYWGMVLFFCSPTAWAFKEPAHSAIPDLDKRREQGAKAEWPAAKIAAAEKLKARLPKVRIDLDEVVGSPKMVSSTEGYLSGPNGEGRAISLQGARAIPANDPHRPVKAFLTEHSALYGHGAEVLQTARKIRDNTTPHNGLRTVVWEQQLDDIPVFEGVMIGHTTKHGELVNLSSQFLPDLARAANAGTPNRAALQKAPVISADRAIVAAALSIAEPLRAEAVAPLEAKPDGAQKRQRFRAGNLPGEAEARLVWLPMNSEAMRLCWQVELTRRTGGERFRFLIDAENGELLVRRCLTVYLTDASYRIFTSDSPSPFSPAHPTPSTNQPPLVPRVLITLPALNTNASPIGWISDGGNETRGNNVDAHLDRNGDDFPDLPRPQGSPFRVFDFPIDFSQGPETYGEAAAVQLFYWCNFMHDQLYELGFDEAAGNFQKDNFGRGGLGNDAIVADAQDGSGVNNANFTPTSDGTPSRIQMFVFTGTNPDRDGDFDADIVIHEYTHGLSDRLVGGGVGISALQTGGMGEGWSDFYAITLLSEADDDLDGTYPVGGYVTLQFFGLQENYYFGVRRYPYSTDLTKNPLTFKDIDPAQIDPHDGVPASPIQPFNPLFANEVHSAGEVWCVTLWEARANLIRKYGFATGNRLILQLVTDGMKLSPPNPNFLQARDAIILADQVNNGGANFSELWAAFAKRGMGFSATSPSSSTTSGLQEAFDLPDGLLILPSTGLLVGGPQTGPFDPPCKTYFLTNRTTAPLTWTAVNTQLWLTVSPSSGTLAPHTGINVTVCLNESAAALPLGNVFDTVTFSNATSHVVQTRVVQLRVIAFASAPFVEDFETGVFQSYWSISGSSGSRSLVTQENGPHGGSYHLTMDTDGSSGNARNEVTLGIDLGGYSNVVLKFWARSFADEPDGPPPIPFTDAADFDGVAISADGNRWYEVQGLRALSGNYAEFEVDLDAAIAEHGLSYNETFRIRFNQYDNNPIPFDGIGIDDISITGIPSARLMLAIPSQATEGNGVLAGQGRITLALPSGAALRVSLTSSDQTKLVVPPSVTIPAGATTAAFDLTVVDNAVFDGTQSATISANAPGFFGASGTMLVHDNESAKLKVKLPGSGKEGDGLLAKRGEVKLDVKTARDIRVALTSGDTNEVQVPFFVIIPAGQKSAMFDLTIVDDTEIDKNRKATITAHVENWIDGSDQIEVHDNDDDKRLDLTLPSGASEGNGTLIGAGLVQISGSLERDLVVSLVSADPTEVLLPFSVIIPAGKDSASFDVTVVDDSTIDGIQKVKLTASARGFKTDTVFMSVLDNETPPVPYEPNPLHQSTNNSLDTNLSWKPGIGEVVANGGFETGDFTGWQQRNIDYGSFVINDGIVDPDGTLGAEVPLPAYAGKFNAVTIQCIGNVICGGGRHVLYQDIVIPADAESALLTWADRIRNHAIQFLPGIQEFRVEIRDTSDNVLALGYTTKPGDPFLNDWVQRSFDLTSFRGRTIRLAFVEEDHLGYFNVHLDNISVILGSTGTTSFDVYFGTSPIPGPAQLLGNTTNAFWDLPKLALNTTYYWQVISKRGAARTAGPIWKFTTRGVGSLDHFEWSTIPSPQLVNQPFAVTVTAKDDINNTVSNFTGRVALSGIDGPPNASAIVMTEIDTGPNDKVEFANASGRPIDISGWTITIYGRFIWPAPHFTFTVPSNSVCSAGAVFQLVRAGTAPGSFPTFFAGTAFLWNNDPFGNPIAVLLRDPSGAMVDFFCAVDADPSRISRPIPIPADEWMGNPVGANTNALLTYQRVGQTDHNNLSDWAIAAPSAGTLNAGLALPFENRLPVVLSPATLSNFVKGVWSGPLTVQTIANSLRLLANDGQGHLGFANLISVSAVNDLAVNVSDSPDLVILGNDVTYTVTITNNGPFAATGVVLTDALRGSIALASATPSQGTCTSAGGVITCVLGTLAGGASATVTIVGTTTGLGVLTNSANVTRDEPDGYEANNTDQETTTVNLPVITISDVNTRLILGVPTPNDDVTVTEGDLGTTNANFAVRLSAASRLPVSVGFFTSEGSATPGVDFIPTSGTIVFPPGSTNQTVAVPVIGDALDELTESFMVNLFAPSEAVIGDGSSVGRIIDNDPAPMLSVNDVTVLEGALGTSTQALFIVRLSAPTTMTVSANFSTSNGTASAGSDYQPTSGTLVFPPGLTTQSVSVVVNGDKLFETNETFFFNLSSPNSASLGDSQGAATILDDDASEIAGFLWDPVPSPQRLNQPFLATITAKDGLNNIATHFTGRVALQGVAFTTNITIGTGTMAWQNPMGTLYHDARTQVIYLPGEVGSAGQITALSLDVATIPGQTLGNWTIRMKHTPLTSYSKPAWESTDWLTVYQKNEPVAATGWVTFFFATPFVYNGIDSLMVDFSFNNSSFSTDGECRYVATTQPRSIYFQTDSAFGDPLQWMGTNSPPPLAAKRVPNIRLSVERRVSITPTNSANFVNGIWMGPITIHELATNLLLRALDNDGHIANANTFDVIPLAEGIDELWAAWQVQHFGSSQSPQSGPNDDPDGDGATNLKEYRAGTDPLDPASVLVVTSVQIAGADVRIRFTTSPGRSYRVERTHDLSQSAWTPVSTEVPGTGAIVQVTDAGGAGGQNRFYRVRLMP